MVLGFGTDLYDRCWLAPLLAWRGVHPCYEPCPPPLPSPPRPHSGTTRYVRHILGFPFSKLGRRLAPACTVVAAECVAIQAACAAGFTPHLSATPVALMAGVVGLLLSFRTNASLSRFYEARGALATMVNRVTDITRVGIEYLPPDAPATAFSARSGETRTSQLARYVAAAPHTLVAQLEGLPPSALAARVDHLLDAHEVALLTSSEASPFLVAVQMITSVVGVGAPMDHHVRVKVDNGVTALLDVAGTAEKLLRTPIPLSYTRHTSRVTLLWCFSIPLVLFGEAGPMWAAASSCLITFLLLGVEDIGVAIEEPFHVLPMRQLCESAEADVFQLLRTARVVGAGWEGSAGGVDGASTWGLNGQPGSVSVPRTE